LIKAKKKLIFNNLIYLGSKTGNRRTANIRSVGYSDLFCLTKQDLWEVSAEYSSARETLIERGKAHLRKDNLLDEDASQEAEQDQAAIPVKLTQIQENIIHLEARLQRLVGEYKSNMNTLGNRLEIVEQLAEEKRIDIDYNQKTIRRVVDQIIDENDV